MAVIVVDHDGGDMTLACLRALAATEWPGRLRVVLVDNASARPLGAAAVAALGGELVPSACNLGFAGGVNLGLQHVGTGTPDGPELVALMNNDAFVAPGWLAPLVAALDADAGLGAAQSKLLFEPVFAPLTVSAPLRPQRRGPEVGVRVDAPPGSVFGAGFDAIRPGEWWTTAPEAVLYVPAASDPAAPVVADEAAAGATAADTVVDAAAAGLTVRLSFEGAAGATVDGRSVPVPGAVDVALPTARCSVVQNAGNELTPALWVRDRGAREPDDGRFDEPCAVWGWCGGGVLLRGAYLDDVGWMDERFFLYWEDVDLSWRGALRGWRYGYVPASVVRHRHGASMGALNPRFEALNQRNRLVVLARHAGGRAAARALARTAAEAAWFAWRDVVVVLVRERRRPSWRRSSVRVRALAGAAAMLARRPRAATGR